MQNINWHSVRTKAILVIMFIIGLLPLVAQFPELKSYENYFAIAASILLYVEHQLQGNSEKSDTVI